MVDRPNRAQGTVRIGLAVDVLTAGWIGSGLPRRPYQTRKPQCAKERDGCAPDSIVLLYLKTGGYVKRCRRHLDETKLAICVGGFGVYRSCGLQQWLRTAR